MLSMKRFRRKRPRYQEINLIQLLKKIHQLLVMAAIRREIFTLKQSRSKMPYPKATIQPGELFVVKTSTGFSKN